MEERGHVVCGWGVGGDEGRSTGFEWHDGVGRAGCVLPVWLHGVWEAVGMFWAALGVARCGAPSVVARMCDAGAVCGGVMMHVATG